MDARTAHSDTDRPYVPGLGRGWLTPLYDTVHRLGGVGRLHAEMVRRAGIEPGRRVLDVGCGTGNLLLALGRDRRDLDLAGLDSDPRALSRAARKARRAGLAVRWDRGFADALPQADATVDVVFSSLMLHHLDPPQKAAMLAEVHRVLRPGGVLVLADVDGDMHDHQHGPFRRRMERSDRLRDNADLPGRIAAAGLVPDPAVPVRLRVGTVDVIRAVRGS
jgi:2-polyprenyl-3-methyl-5-hydroxy-6-metoxy-1,4-benzoquinol methylase